MPNLEKHLSLFIARALCVGLSGARKRNGVSVMIGQASVQPFPGMGGTAAGVEKSVLGILRNQSLSPLSCM